MSAFQGLLSAIHEYRDWGYNALTFSFLCAVVITVSLQLPGAWAQLRSIWVAKSTRGVDSLLPISFFGYFLASFLYGIDSGSGALLFNPVVLGPCALLIACRLWWKRGFTVGEWSGLALWLLAIVVDAVLQWKAYFYVGASIVLLIGPLKQIKTMKEKATSEGLNEKFPLYSGIACVVWVFYGLALRDPFISSLSILYGFLYWYMFRLTIRLKTVLSEI